jgi:methylmalonyl-CoA mutase
VKPIYGAGDVASLDFLDTWPGIAPYLRGPYPTMYVNQPWTIRQYAGFSTAEDSNAFYRRNLAAGQKGLSVAFDLATHRGYDSDHPRVSGDVGMAGVAIDSIYDMRTLFSGIPLDQMSVSMTMNGAVLPCSRCSSSRPKNRACRRRSLSGTIQNDILKEFMVRNTYIYPPAPSMRIISDIFGLRRRTCRSSIRSRFPAITCRKPARRRISNSPTRSPMASNMCAPASKPASTSTLRAAPVLLLGDRHEFLHGGRQAARRAPALGEADEGVQSEGCARAVAAHALPDLRLVAHRAGRFQQRDAHAPIEAMAATQGHTQSLHTNALDEALALPTDFSARIARNTQLFLQQESGTTRIIDPWGGSFYVERLTLRAGAEGVGHIQEVESLGGMAKAIEAGMPKLRIEEAAARTQARIDAGRAIGDRRQQVSSRRKKPIDVLKVDNSAVRAVADRQAAQLRSRARSEGAASRARCAHRRRRKRQRQSARARHRRRAREGDGRRNFRCAGRSVRPPPRRDQTITGVYKREVSAMSTTRSSGWRS